MRSALSPSVALPLRLALAAPLAFALFLVACASTRAPANTTLAGTWQIDRSASDDVDAKVTAAVQAAQNRFASRRRRLLGIPRGAPEQQPARGGDSAGGSGAGATGESLDTPGDILGNGRRIAPDFSGLRARLREVLAAPMQLVLAVQPEDVQIRSDGLPPEDYQPGEVITRLNEYGTARLTARWSEGAFELRERYTSGARLTVHYQLDGHGHLEYLRTLEDPTIGNLRLRSVYQRG